MSIKIGRDRFKTLLADVKALTSKEVLVGVPSTSAERHEADGTAEPINNATIAYIHENGAPEANIPPRPFLALGIRENANALAAQIKKAGLAALAGKSEDVDKGFHSTGLAAVSAVRRKIDEGPFDPLSEVTLQRRRSRGRTGTKPLIDTGALRRSINYVIRPKGKKK